ncbi:hypothetical protein DFH08DRAFT_955717 [Mycena albidolilacea]|uniref:Uncharacterized protein n=1 Tax=Mycena albidolilacea TaxID=1033008 RepID=A0AAD7ABP3_9AGAR|nr:hypothetical protein DFH08DRAFT_955717 [Mycena albidolilacea]
MHITLDNTFNRLKLEDGSETWDFYVVTLGRVPGIYMHWEDASVQVDKFKGSAHKKHLGWSAATSTFDHTRCPGAYDSCRPHSTPPPSMPPRAPVVISKNPVVAPTHPHQPRDALPACMSTPPTPTTSKKHLLPTWSAACINKNKHTKNVYSLQSFGPTLAKPSAVRAAKLTADGRRTDIQIVPIQRERAPAPLPPDPEDEWVDMQVDDEPPVDSRPPRKQKWYATTDTNLRHWAENYRDEYLRVLVSREGFLGEQASDCFGPQLLCLECLLEGHRFRPLCRIEAWNGTFFNHRELWQVGLQGTFVVITPNGFHHVAVDFCQCRRSGSQSHWEQLLSYGWFPMTPDNPQSAITISALKLFHAISLQGKTTAYHFFNALAKITNNMGSNTFKVFTYPRLYHIVLMFCSVGISWRFGSYANSVTFALSNTEAWAMILTAVGVNLPQGWERVPIELRYLYTIFLAIDTCFRLKRRKISSWLADPSIQDRWAYFVRSLTYEEFVKTLGEQKEMSTCTGLAALDHANTKYSQGCAMMGCGMVTCGCHEVVCKNSVGDLQAGENAWRHLRDLLFFLLSYDIMCQWVKNLRERLLNLPPIVRFQLTHYFVKFVIPKLHILGHLKFCQDFFSLLYILGAAQADMEEIERIWSSSGLMGASTREMGLGSCQDTLDDFWHYWNWNKVVGMGMMLRGWLLRARKELAQQEEALEEFTAVQEAEAPAWKKAVDEYETGVSSVNPYQLPHAGKHSSLKELTDFVTRCTRISRQIRRLRLLQRVYSPGALQHLVTAEDPVEPAESEWAPLLLPSGLSPAQVALPFESLEAIRHGLIVKRRLQMYKTLNSHRQHQNTHSRTLVDGQQQKIDLAARKYRQARAACLALAPAAGECSWHALEKSDLRLPEDEEEAKKRRQRAMKGKQKEAAQVNENGEVRGVPGMGEKNCLVSCAGSTEGAVGDVMHDSMRMEFSKAYARVKCWREETRLLQEEMAQCLLTLEWQAAQWDLPRQATVRRKLAHCFRQMWWRLSERVAQPQRGNSAQSSGEEEWDDDEEGPDAEAVGPGNSEEHGMGGEDVDGEGEGGNVDLRESSVRAVEEEEEGEAEDAEGHRARMDKLLAIQTTSLQQYDEL